MRITNSTTLSLDTVREVIRHCRPPGIANFDVMLRNSDGIAGTAYTEGSSYHKGVKGQPFVVLRVPGKRRCWSNSQKKVVILPPKFPRFVRPYQYGQLKGKRYVIANLEEALVYIAAHELRHLWQAGAPKGKRRRGMTHGARGRFSEIDTESYAINRLRAWRRRDDANAGQATMAVRLSAKHTVENILADFEHDAKMAAQAAADAEIAAARKQEAVLATLQAESTRLAANAKRWDAKLRRATNALKKIARRQKAIAKRQAILQSCK